MTGLLIVSVSSKSVRLTLEMSTPLSLKSTSKPAELSGVDAALEMETPCAEMVLVLNKRRVQRMVWKK